MVGAQRPVMSVNEPKKTDARSIGACSAAVQQKPTSINISPQFQKRMARRVSVFAMLGISSYFCIIRQKFSHEFIDPDLYPTTLFFPCFIGLVFKM
jgi:hypothetical protein